VQAHSLAWNTRNRLIYSCNHRFDETNEISDRPVLKGEVAFEREVGGIDLKPN
jgi:hypothetical protein